MRFVCLGVALGTPLASIGQTAVVAPPIAMPQSSPSPPASSLDTAKRLEGRLFFSAQQRQRMDAARRRGFVFGDNSQLVEAPPSVLNGFVKRSDGNTAVWVDGDVRWNANTRNVGSLLPGDVGGPAEYVKSATEGAKVLAPKPAAIIKKAVKSRSNKKSKPRLLP